MRFQFIGGQIRRVHHQPIRLNQIGVRLLLCFSGDTQQVVDQRGFLNSRSETVEPPEHHVSSHQLPFVRNRLRDFLLRHQQLLVNFDQFAEPKNLFQNCPCRTQRGTRRNLLPAPERLQPLVARLRPFDQATNSAITEKPVSPVPAPPRFVERRLSTPLAELP